MTSEEPTGAQIMKRLWNANPDIYRILKESYDTEEARWRLYDYLLAKERDLHMIDPVYHPLEWTQTRDCITTFKSVISRRSERMAKASTLDHLRRIAHGKPEEPVTWGFVEEMRRLFLGVIGKSGIYDPKRTPKFLERTGREAAILRSKELDRLSDYAEKRIRSHPTGLQSSIGEERRANCDRILDYFGASLEDWNSWKWQFKHSIDDERVLRKLIQLSRDEAAAIRKTRRDKLPFGITPYYVSLMDPVSAKHDFRDRSLRTHVIPSRYYVDMLGRLRACGERPSDFMLESDTSPEDLIVRRYPMICILKPVNTCPQICVYCQRNWEIEGRRGLGSFARLDRLNRALDWLANQRSLHEVLITGGDPLILPDSRINYLLERISAMEHIYRIRIGTRTPVTMPMRITDDLMTILARYHEPGQREIMVVTHFSHPLEVTPGSLDATMKINKAGIHVYNQAVYTFYNSRRFELVALRRALRRIGVDPYYTFSTKGKEETKDFRVPIARILQERKEEARLSPGTIRVDEPVYNVPGLGKNYLRANQHHDVIMILPDGRRMYEFHPWEKKLAPVQTYVDADVSIWDYLERLREIGEDPADYRTIWYYY